MEHKHMQTRNRKKHNSTKQNTKQIIDPQKHVWENAIATDVQQMLQVTT